MPDSAAANYGVGLLYNWTYAAPDIWHLNVDCRSGCDLAGYSFVVNYDNITMSLLAVAPDSSGANNNILNSRGGLTPLFLTRDDGSSVAISNVIKDPNEYTAAEGSGFLADLVFSCSFPSAISLDNIVLMDSEKRLNVIGLTTDDPITLPVPERFALYPNYPNPFNPTTTINFDLPIATKVVIRIYDVTGREIAILANRHMDAGQHSVVWNGENKRGRAVASGVYFCRLQAGSLTQTKKMVMLR